MKLKQPKGFTLIEILLVVALIALLAGIVIIAVNPSKQLANGRNARRQADVSTILNGVYQYSIDNNGHLPPTILQNADCTSTNTLASEICRTGSGASCDGLTDLSAITNNQTYLPAIPVDPSLPATGNNTGYFINLTDNNRVTVCAADSELGEQISATR